MAENAADEANKRTKGSRKREKFDFDSYWKDLIERYFYPLLKRAIPELYEKADVTKKQSMLDKEFRSILNTSDPTIHTSPHFGDFLIEVPMKDGSESCVLLHIESQQGSGGGNLAERMNHYRCLIYAHYRREPVALAIIAGALRKKERFYSHTHYGTEVVYRYNNLVLAELDDGELKTSESPIDLALYSAKCSFKAKEELQKYKFLRTLTELLADRGLDRNEYRDIDNFMRRIINLTDETLQEQYLEFRQRLAKEGKLMYDWLKQTEERVAERRGMEKGIEKGMEKGIEKGMEKGVEKGKEEVARNLLANGIPLEVITKSTGLPEKRVRALMN